MASERYTYEKLREILVGQEITKRRLSEAGISLTSKGKWGLYNERLLGIPPNSSRLPDLGEDGELKTTVRDRAGRLRESIAICRTGQDPLHKLERIALVIARDLNDSTQLVDREVKNEDVLILKPTAVVRHVLLHDYEILKRDPHSNGGYFLQTRTKGGSRAYYLKKGRVAEYVERLRAAAALREIGDRLKKGLQITDAHLAGEGYKLTDKGRFGRYVRTFAKGQHGVKIRTAVLQGDGVKEDLLVCPEEEDPVVALARMIYVPMSATMTAAGEQRVVEDIIYLAPTDLILHALEYDRKLIKTKRPDEAQFLRLKSHGARRGEGLSWYIKASSVSLYVELLRNQPI